MELQFNKSVIPCLRTAVQQVQTQEQTQEVRLTDEMPDIGKVLASWGQVLLRGKDWNGGAAGMSGGVMVWVLYMPEDGSQVQCVETWLPFQLRWDLPDMHNDGTLNVMPILRSVDARTLSARKLMVRAGVGAVGKAMVADEMEIYSPDQLPEDVCILKRNYPVCIPVEAGEKAFVIEETLTLPATAPAIRKLLRYGLHPELVESKVVADKIVMRGMAVLDILYLGEDGQIYSRDFELPFSQYEQLQREYDTATAQITMAVTALELEPGQEESLNLKAGMTGQYVICDSPVLEIVEDAYSPGRAVEPQIQQLLLPSVLDVHRETVHAEHSVEMNASRVADVQFYPDIPRQHREGDKLCTELSGAFQILCYDPAGGLQSAISRWEGRCDMDVARDAKVETALCATGRPQSAIGGGNASLRADMLLDAQVFAGEGLCMVTGLKLSEAAEPEPNRPSLILCRAGEDSLWEIAKRTGSTVEVIQKANALQQEPDSTQMLLIPVI